MSDTRRESPPQHVILVGVVDDLADAVLRVAVHLAQDLRCGIVCAHVDPNRYVVGEDRDGTVRSLPIDPDLPEFDEDAFDPALLGKVEQRLTGTGVTWSTRTLAGDPASALGHLANVLDARMIVVGTHEAGLRTSMREFFRSSVAVHLAHRQHRPVLVVPLSPVEDGAPLPWEATQNTAIMHARREGSSMSDQSTSDPTTSDPTTSEPATSDRDGFQVDQPDGPAVEIASITARQILDSRGHPTVAVDLRLADGARVSASAPAGASTGEFEAVELRDGGAAYGGRGVRRALRGIADEIAPELTGKQWTTLRAVDDAMTELDGTGNLSRLGANAIVAVSIAAARAFAHTANVPLHAWVATITGSRERLPVPHFNVLNGGAHAANPLEFQEFMIAPVGAADEDAAVEAGAEIYHALSARVKSRFHTAGLGDEGGFAPDIANPKEAMDLLLQAIGDAGYTAGVDDVAIAIDPAANGFYERDGYYRIEGRRLGRDELVAYYVDLLDAYPLRSIEDGFAEDDFPGWQALFDAVGERTQLVGDDLYVTDMRRIADGARERYSNAALIKPNQIGTVSGTFDAIETARRLGMACMVSHRSGETTDTFIADLVVGTGVGQIKTGAPARGERVAKYNRLMKIAERHPALPYGLAPASGRD